MFKETARFYWQTRQHKHDEHTVTSRFKLSLCTSDIIVAVSSRTHHLSLAWNYRIISRPFPRTVSSHLRPFHFFPCKLKPIHLYIVKKNSSFARVRIIFYFYKIIKIFLFFPNGICVSFNDAQIWKHTFQNTFHPTSCNLRYITREDQLYYLIIPQQIWISKQFVSRF